MSQSVSVTDVDGPPDRKAVLFCPTCDHASPVDGDWVVHDRATTLEYRCPDCDARITERNRERASDRQTNPAVRLWSAWLRAVNAWVWPSRRTRV